MPELFPTRTRVYRSHHLDSTRWDRYTPRPDDIVISTSYKSGTTWTQGIVRQLVVHAMQQAGIDDPAQLPEPDTAASLWLDGRWHRTLDELHTRLEAQQHRRFLKTHLALDGLPFYPQVKYLVVGRDPRDVFMSLWNHYAAYTDHFYARINDDPERPGAPCPRCPANIHDFWAMWINRGWFGWEQEGYPFWGNMHHTQSWWAYRHLDNLLFVHYADMLADPTGEIQRIARFLAIDVNDQALAAVAVYTSLPAMRQRAAAAEAQRDRLGIFRGGARTFFNKGVNRRWQGVLSDEELVMYQQTRDRVLSPDCAHWLEQGRQALSSPITRSPHGAEES